MIKEEKYGHFLFNLCKIGYFLKFGLEQNFHRFRQKIIIVPFQFSLQNTSLPGDSPCWVIVDVGRVRNLRGGKWGRGVWVCWVAFWKEEVVLGFNRNVQLYSRSWF